MFFVPRHAFSNVQVKHGYYPQDVFVAPRTRVRTGTSRATADAMDIDALMIVVRALESGRARVLRPAIS
jgi:hypothetical protein